MGSEQFSHSPESLQKTEVTEQANANMPEILTELNTDDTLKSQIQEITMILDDPKYSKKLQIELRNELNVNADKIRGFVMNEDVNSIRMILESIIATIKNKKTEERVEKTEERVEKTEERVEKNHEDLKKKLELADRRNNALFHVFGGPEKFQEKFPEHTKWQQEASTEALKEDPSLRDRPEELATRVQVRVLLDHRADIEAKAPPGSLQAVYRDLEASAQELRIPYSYAQQNKYPGCPTNGGNQEKINLYFSPGERDRLLRRGDEVLSNVEGDKNIRKVVDMRTGQIYTENDNGIRIASKEVYHSSCEIDANIQVLETDIRDIDTRLDSQQQFLSRTSARFGLPSIDSLSSENFDRLIQKFESDSHDPDANPEDRKKASEILAQIQTMKTEYQELQRQKEALILKLTAYKQAKTTHQALYQKTLQQETEASRSNLTFLASTHLDSILRNDGIQTLIREIDLHRDTFPVTTLDKASSLSLDKEWKEPEKKLFAAGISRLLGMEGEKAKQLFSADGYTMRAVAPDGHTPMERFLKDRLTSRGIYESGKIPPVTEEGVKKGMVVRAKGGEVESELDKII